MRAETILFLNAEIQNLQNRLRLEDIENVFSSHKARYDLKRGVRYCPVHVHYWILTPHPMWTRYPSWSELRKAVPHERHSAAEYCRRPRPTCFELNQIPNLANSDESKRWLYFRQRSASGMPRKMWTSSGTGKNSWLKDDMCVWSGVSCTCKTSVTSFIHKATFHSRSHISVIARYRFGYEPTQCIP